MLRKAQRKVAKVHQRVAKLERTVAAACGFQTASSAQMWKLRDLDIDSRSYIDHCFLWSHWACMQSVPGFCHLCLCLVVCVVLESSQCMLTSYLFSS